MLQISLWTALVSGPALAQSTLSGRVVALSDGERIPAAGAWVVASSGSPSRTIASVEADAQGAYHLEGLPEGRVEFTVSQRGYFTIEAGESDSPTLARICPAGGSCGEADFVLAKASVIDGYLLNPFGDPVSETPIRLTPTSQGEDEARWQSGLRAVQRTDDHGYFRFFDVPAGEYDLSAELQQGNAQAYTAETERIRVEAGVEESVYIALTVTSDPVRIAGSIAGLQLVDGETAHVFAAPASGGGRYPSPTGRVLRVDTSQGTPRLSGDVPPGDYVLIAEIHDPSNEQGPRAVRRIPLGRHRIDRDRTDLQLTARSGATIRVRIRYDGITPQRSALLLIPLDEGGKPASFGTTFGPRRVWVNDLFERRDLMPGRYRLESDAAEYFITRETEFALAEGQTLETEIVLSAAFAEIRGVVRAPRGEDSAGPFLVAIKTPGGKVLSMQTDTEGSYNFERLLPGDYGICAWADRSVRPEDESAWTAAGAAVRRFRIGAGDQTEILLTAKP